MTSTLPTHQELSQSFENTPWPLGLSSTIYSMVWPETEALIKTSLTQDAEALIARHNQPWLKQQDQLHQPFFKAYEHFAGPAIEGGEDAFKGFGYQYPSAGASEAIRESIHQLGTQILNAENTGTSKKPVMIVFEGEYEGYEAIGRIDGLEVITLRRDHWKEDLAKKLSPQLKGSFFISQPSAIDGSIWPEFPFLLDEIQRHHPSIDVRLDLTYVGATAAIAPIEINHPTVSQVFFSLSKPFGAYYRRIGGCYSKEPIPSLWGNAWFKNLDALSFGETLLSSEKTPFDRHARWAPLQLAAIEKANLNLKTELDFFDAYIKASNAIIIGHLEFKTPEGRERFEKARLDPTAGSLHQLAKLASRGSLDKPSISQRVCLTPWMETLLTHDPRFMIKSAEAKSKVELRSSPSAIKKVSKRTKP